MARSNPSLRSSAEPDERIAYGRWRPALFATLCLALGAPTLEARPQDASAVEGEVTDIDAVEVIEKRPDRLYRSVPAERTPPTVFNRHWRRPVNLRQIGLEGGVVPIIVRYASEQTTRAARRIPGWKKPEQPAIARPPPLDEAQMQRAADLREER